MHCEWSTSLVPPPVTRSSTSRKTRPARPATHVRERGGSTTMAEAPAGAQTPSQPPAETRQTCPHGGGADAAYSACGCGRRWRQLQQRAA
eukprot:3598510-Prymnesium_polylepis.1